MRHSASMSLNIEAETQKTFWNSLSSMKGVVYLFKFNWNVFPLAINNKTWKVQIRLAAEQATRNFSNQWWPTILAEYMCHSTPMNSYVHSSFQTILPYCNVTGHWRSLTRMAGIFYFHNQYNCCPCIFNQKNRVISRHDISQVGCYRNRNYPISQSIYLLNCPVDTNSGVTSRHCIGQRHQNWLNNETHTHVHTKKTYTYTLMYRTTIPGISSANTGRVKCI